MQPQLPESAVSAAAGAGYELTPAQLFQVVERFRNEVGRNKDTEDICRRMWELGQSAECCFPDVFMPQLEEFEVRLWKLLNPKQ